LGSNTLTLNRKPKVVDEISDENRNSPDVAWDPKPEAAADKPPNTSPIPPGEPVAPQRKHQKPERAKARGQWFAVLRIPRDDAYHGRPMFRHPTRETAESEAEYLAELQPGVLFVVVEAVAWHHRDKQPRPEPQAQAA
jgi:hypothetical protein